MKSVDESWLDKQLERIQTLTNQNEELRATLKEYCEAYNKYEEFGCSLLDYPRFRDARLKAENLITYDITSFACNEQFCAYSSSIKEIIPRCKEEGCLMQPKSKFDENEWNSFHDTVEEASNRSYTIKELKNIYQQLPNNLRLDAERWGLSDSVVRDHIYVFLKEQPDLKDILINGIESERDWKEDFNDDNGKYQRDCIICKQLFYGYKRRVVCKVCDSKE
jgi:hypothetical protein